MSQTSPFLMELKAFIAEKGLNVIRVSEVYHDGDVSTLELAQISACQNVYSVAKAFTMTAAGLLYDRGLLRPDEKICDILSDEITYDAFAR